MFRRTFLALTVVFLVPLWGTGFAANLTGNYSLFGKVPDETLSFYNTHTHETLTVKYRSSVLEDVNYFLRDHRTGQAREISSDLLDLLYQIKVRTEAAGLTDDVVFHVISGYRSPETNEMLRQTRGGQAKKSRHMHGDAIDIRVPGVDLVSLRNIAWCQQRGGVGYYKGSEFIHVDTHKVRFWGWKPTAATCKGTNS